MSDDRSDKGSDMAEPTRYTPGFNYSGWEADHPTEPKPGAELDNDFALIRHSIDETIRALKDVRRSDGKIQNTAVDFDALSPAVKAAIANSDFDYEVIEDLLAKDANLADLDDVAEAVENLGLIDALAYGTATDAPGISVPAPVMAFRTNGYHEAGDGGAAVYRRADGEPFHAAKIQTADGAWWEIDSGRLSVLQIGARANGDSNGGGDNQSHLLQAALDYMYARGGGTVVVPYAGTGVYRVDQEIAGRANVTLEIDPAATLDFTNASDGAAFRFQGSVGPEIKLGANATRGDMQITTAEPHGLQAGDWIYLKSQRLACHEDAGDWRLGEPTGSQTGPYFGEPCQVLSVDSDTQVTLSSRIVFPDYRTNDSQETSPNARPAATIQKIDWLEGAVVRGGNIIYNSGSGVFRFSWCYRPFVENVTAFLKSNNARMLRFDTTFGGHHRNLYAHREPGVATGSSSNCFQDVGSWWCTHENWTDVNGWQSIDVSYANGGAHSIEPLILGGTSISSREALTFHPGCFGGSVRGVRSINCSSGINVRSPWVSITQCHAIGQQVSSDSGIKLGPWARYSSVRDNYIFGFRRGIHLHTIGIQGDGPTQRHRIAENNDIHRCLEGIYLGDVQEDEARSEDCGDMIIGNRIFECTTYIRVRPYANGVRVHRNYLRGTGTSEFTAINVDANCVRCSVRDNVLDNLGASATAIRLPNTSDDTTFPPAQFPNPLHDIGGNIFQGTNGTRINLSLHIPPNRSYGRDGPVTSQRSLGSNAVHTFENNSDGARVYLLGPDDGINLIRLGNPTDPDVGGILVSQSSGVLNLRAESAERVQVSGDSFYPIQDGSYSLGGPSNLWSEVYAASDTINTSDERLKQDIRAFTEAELRALHRVDLVLYRLRDAVDRKGEDARTHAGVIAQQVIAVFADEGLDAFDYGFVCADPVYDRVSWEVEGVEHERYEPRLDEDGEQVVQLSVRYAELLTALRAADRARMEDIETRLSALEG